MEKDATLPLHSNVRGPHPEDATAKVVALNADWATSTVRR